jgi:hypothetical protein
MTRPIWMLGRDQDLARLFDLHPRRVLLRKPQQRLERMAPLKAKRAAAESARDPLKIARLPGTNNSDAILAAPTFQARFVMRRCRLTALRARIVADLAFGGRAHA